MKELALDRAALRSRDIRIADLETQLEEQRRQLATVITRAIAKNRDSKSKVDRENSGTKRVPRAKGNTLGRREIGRSPASQHTAHLRLAVESNLSRPRRIIDRRANEDSRPDAGSLLENVGEMPPCCAGSRCLLAIPKSQWHCSPETASAFMPRADLPAVFGLKAVGSKNPPNPC